MNLVVNKVVCGACAKKKNLKKEQRIAMFESLPNGFCRCACGRFFQHFEGTIKEVSSAVRERVDSLRY